MRFYRLLRPVWSPILNRALRDRLDRDARQRWVDDVWARFQALIREQPGEPTFGARIMAQLSVATLAIFQALVAAGLNDEQARQKTTQITWRIYFPSAMLLWRLAGLFSRDPLARVRIAMSWAMRWPYTAPGYRMAFVPADEGVAFDVERCPAADTFARFDRSDLCVSAWCALDDPLADRWGLALTRTGTLASGAARCDFSFRKEE